MVKSRLQTQNVFAADRYTGMADCARRLYAAEGWRAFWRGFEPCILRSVPANAVRGGGPWQGGCANGGCPAGCVNGGRAAGLCRPALPALTEIPKPTARLPSLPQSTAPRPLCATPQVTFLVYEAVIKALAG